MLRWLTVASTLLACLGCGAPPPCPSGFLVYVRDREGSVLAAVDDQGKILRSSDTDGFGLELSLSSTGTQVPRAFLDMEIDEESGYLVFAARYYDPTTAQWISPDPRLLATLDCSDRVQDCNPYTFAGDRPLEWTDPDGRASFPFSDVKGRGGMMFTLGFYGPDAKAARDLVAAAVRSFKGPVVIRVATAIYKTVAEIPLGVTRVEGNRAAVSSFNGKGHSSTDPDYSTIHLLASALDATSKAEQRVEVIHELIHSAGNPGEGYTIKDGQWVSFPENKNGIMGNYHLNPEAAHLTDAEIPLLQSPTDRDGAAKAFNYEDASLASNPTYKEDSSAGDASAASK